MKPLPVIASVLVLVAAPGAAAAGGDLGAGDSGPRVRALQETLARTAFLPRGAVTGTFDQRTWHAVVAFQGWNGLVRDGVVGPRTRSRLRHARRPVPWSRRQGFEVHVSEQVLLMVRERRVRRAVHVSTGAGGRTPLGRYTVRRRERMSWSVPFQTWMPYAQYFTGGYAMHEYPSVPAYPASHGCVRLPAQEAPAVWAFGRLGMRVWIYDRATEPSTPSATATSTAEKARPSACGDTRAAIAAPASAPAAQATAMASVTAGSGVRPASR